MIRARPVVASTASSGSTNLVWRKTAPAKSIRFEFFVEDGLRSHYLLSDKIDFIEAQRDFSQINAEGYGYLLTQRLTQIERLLDPEVFVRIDDLYLLNLRCIDSVGRHPDGKNYGAMLHDGTYIPLSQPSYEQLHLRLGLQVTEAAS